MKNKIVAAMDCFFNYQPQPPRIKQSKYVRGEHAWVNAATKHFNSIRKHKKL